VCVRLCEREGGRKRTRGKGREKKHSTRAREKATERQKDFRKKKSLQHMIHAEFSKVGWLHNGVYTITTELTFEKFYKHTRHAALPPS